MNISYLSNQIIIIKTPMKKCIPDFEIWNCELVKPCNEQLRTLEILELELIVYLKCQKLILKGFNFTRFLYFFLRQFLTKSLSLLFDGNIGGLAATLATYCNSVYSLFLYHNGIFGQK